jgi:hypothetical protein
MLPKIIGQTAYSFKPQCRYQIGSRAGIGILVSGRPPPVAGTGTCSLKIRFAPDPASLSSATTLAFNILVSGSSLIQQNFPLNEQRRLPFFVAYPTSFAIAIGLIADLTQP